MTALDAGRLHDALARSGVDGVAGRCFDRSAEIIDVVWQIAVGADLAFPQPTGPEPTGIDVSNWYLSRVLQRARTDAVSTVTRTGTSPTTRAIVSPRMVR